MENGSRGATTHAQQRQAWETGACAVNDDTGVATVAGEHTSCEQCAAAGRAWHGSQCLVVIHVS